MSLFLCLTRISLGQYYQKNASKSWRLRKKLYSGNEHTSKTFDGNLINQILSNLE